MDAGSFPTQAEVSAISGAAFMMRRADFETLGGFDNLFFLYMEDTDLSWRVLLGDRKCVYVPQSVVYHDYQLRFGPRKTLYQEYNRYIILLKHFRWSTLLLLLPVLLLAEVVTWGYILLNDRSHWNNKFYAYWLIVKHWPHIMQKRQHVQAFRKVRDRDLIAQFTYQITYEQTELSFASQVAKRVFNPLFYAYHTFTLAAMWW